MGKIVKRIFITLGVLIGLLLLSAFLVPILFKDKILAVVKKQVNENLNATTDFKDVSLSLFHHFPQLSVGIEKISIVGKDAFANDTLIASQNVEVSVDLMKAIKGTYDILNIALVSPRIHAIVMEDGKSNWDITKPTPPGKQEESKPFAFKLRKYSIENGFVEYTDKQGKMHMVMNNLNHNGAGDFTSDEFTLRTVTTIDAMSYTYGNIPYLNKVKTSMDLDLDINNKTSKYTFNTDKIQINGLRLSSKGFVQMPDTTNMAMDIQFNTPSNDFKDILSLVPGIYQANFKDIKTTGKVALKGYVKGNYNAKQMPAYGVDLAINDGSFQYPDLPQKVSNIQVKMLVNNPDGITDHTVVNIEKGHVDFGADPFDFRMLMKTPVSNQWVDAAMKGKLDLANMQKFMKMEAGTKLTGLITADVSVKGSIAAAQKQKFDDLYAAGTVGISNMSYASKDYPDAVTINSLMLSFNPKNVTVSDMKGQYQQINFTGDGSINNLLGYYLHNDALNGSLHFTADKVDLNKLMGTSSQPATAAKTDSNAIPFIVPDNLDIALKVEVGSVHYDNLTLSAVSGGMLIRNQVVNLQNVVAKGLDGTIRMNGFYSTKADKKHPDMQFDYNVESIDIQKTYNTFAFVQKMMPAGKYVSGKMNAVLDMNCKLYGDMTPNMNTVAGKGNMMLLNGVLSNFPVTDQIAEKLKMPQFKSFPVKDMKMFFTFENGRVIVEPYKMKIDQVDAEIAGSHGFDQTIKYGVNMAVPTSMMGNQGQAVVNNLLNQANAKGLNLKLGDKVNLAVNIGGTVTSPKIETNLKNVAGNAVDNIKKEVQAVIQKKVDSVKTVVKDTVKAIKNQAIAAGKDELKKQLLGGGGDTTKKTPLPDPKKVVNDAADKAKEGIRGLFGKKKGG